MALSQDTSTDFSSASGYTLFEQTSGDVVFSGGTMALKASEVATAAARTPQIDVSSWSAINSLVLDITEDIAAGGDYTHRFLFSFDDWSNISQTPNPQYLTYIQALGWFPVASIQTSTSDLLSILFGDSGLGVGEVERLRDWPPVFDIDALSILVGMRREDAGADGEINLITVNYGDDVLSVKPSLQNLGGFPALASGANAAPARPIQVQFAQRNRETFSEGGYLQVAETEISPTMDVTIQFPGLLDTDRDTLMSFLESAKKDFFEWKPHPLWPITPKWQVQGQPTYRQQGVHDGNNVFQVEANVRQYKQ